MGIYDRDYYREKGGFSPFDKPIQACIVLAVIYVCLFLIQFSTQENDFGVRKRSPIAELLELNVSKVLQGEVWRVFTYAFVQNTASIIPLAFNLLFLIWIGRQVEDIYGWKEFLAYFLSAGFLAGLGFTLVAAIDPINEVFLGPVASLTATLFLFALHYPRRTVLLFFVLPCPVWLLAALYVLVNVAGFFGGGVHPAAFAAHAVAAGFAFLYFHYSLRVLNWLPRMPSGSGRRPRSRPSLQIFRDESRDADTASTTAPSSGGLPVSASYASAHTPSSIGASAPPSALDEHLEAKVDEVLKKVKRHGQDSLTDEERAVLFRASEIYRKRRKSEGN